MGIRVYSGGGGDKGAPRPGFGQVGARRGGLFFRVNKGKVVPDRGWHSVVVVAV